MCKQKECPDCHMLVPARTVICTHNGCHHVFDECIPHVATIVHTSIDMDPERDGAIEDRILQHFYLN